MDADFAAIRDGLRRLRESAKPPDVFGSNAHRFRTHPPLSEEAVGAFEAAHRVSLPPEYRGFLLHVGNGGAGPYYGLFKLGEMDDGFGHAPWKENDGFVGVLSEPFPHTGEWNDFTEEPEYDEERADDEEYEADYEKRWAVWERKVYWSPANVNGAIPICHLGCAQRQWLVVTGAEAGNVWYDLRVDKLGLRPLSGGDAERMSFLRWYRSWLDESLRKV